MSALGVVEHSVLDPCELSKERGNGKVFVGAHCQKLIIKPYPGRYDDQCPQGSRIRIDDDNHIGTINGQTGDKHARDNRM